MYPFKQAASNYNVSGSKPDTGYIRHILFRYRRRQTWWEFLTSVLHSIGLLAPSYSAQETCTAGCCKFLQCQFANCLSPASDNRRLSLVVVCPSIFCIAAERSVVERATWPQHNTRVTNSLHRDAPTCLPVAFGAIFHFPSDIREATDVRRMKYVSPVSSRAVDCLTILQDNGDRSSTSTPVVYGLDVDCVERVEIAQSEWAYDLPPMHHQCLSRSRLEM